jgi:voltage-gated potassium channel|tara:strand:- start:36 stop:890 length:855 start_codon:yes stop_codon:yes gene_type:complete
MYGGYGRVMVSDNAAVPKDESSWLQAKIHEIIFEADTPTGKFFDVALLLAIIASVIAVCLESVKSIDAVYHSQLIAIEWTFTILFTVEYLLRIYSTRQSKKYATSFFGLVDLLAILPTYLSLAYAGAQSLIVIRAIRLLRVFRVFKLSRYLGEANILSQAMIQSKSRIIVFLSTITIMSFITGAGMYLVEGPNNGFTSIPQSVYWAITTLTSTGYGDTVPLTPIGKLLAIFIMIMGYSLIIVPTGIISNELMKLGDISTQACLACSKEGHDFNAQFCKHCGEKL